MSYCPACDNSDISQIFQPDLCQCNRCHVIFRSPRPTQKDILECYDSGSTFQLWQAESEKRAILWKKRLELVKSYNKNGSLLDIGTGDGHFLDFAKDIYNASATEVSLSGVRYALARGHNVHHGSILDHHFDNEKFDIITMWHVLEHVPNVHEILSRVETLLKPGGTLLIAVPNELLSLCLFSLTRRRRHPFGMLKADKEIHLTHFTPRTFKNTLQSKFEVKEFGVDDVHVYGRYRHLPLLYVNKLLNFLFKTHFDKAMYIVCRAKD